MHREKLVTFESEPWERMTNWIPKCSRRKGDRFRWETIKKNTSNQSTNLLHYKTYKRKLKDFSSSRGLFFYLPHLSIPFAILTKQQRLGQSNSVNRKGQRTMQSNAIQGSYFMTLALRQTLHFPCLSKCEKIHQRSTEGAKQVGRKKTKPQRTFLAVQ